MSTKLTFAYVKPSRVFSATGNDLFYTDGNVGIGKANPSTRLDVSGNVTISGNVNVDSGLLFIDGSNNRIGVGTTSPSVALDVSGAVTIRNGLRIGASGTNANLVQYGINSTSNSSGTLTVTFPQAFASTPTISATILTTRANVTEYNWLYQLLSVSTTGFTYRVLFTTIAVPSGQYGAGGGDPTSLHWVAYA